MRDEAKLRIAIRDLYRGDGGPLNDYNQGWNDGTDAAAEIFSAEIEAAIARAEKAEAELAVKERDRQYHMDAINRLASFLALFGTSFEVVQAAIDNLTRLARANTNYEEQARSFHEEYRRKCDLETKNLEVRLADTQHRNGTNIVRLERAEAELAAIKGAQPETMSDERIHEIYKSMLCQDDSGEMTADEKKSVDGIRSALNACMFRAHCREQEAKIARMAEALKAADTLIWCHSASREAGRWTTAHAEALRDAGVEP